MLAYGRLLNVLLKNAPEHTTVHVVSDQAKRFYTVMIACLLCTVMDGALQLLLLLQMNMSGFSALGIAVAFSFAELISVATSVVVTFVSLKANRKWTLLMGLGLQIISVRGGGARCRPVRCRPLTLPPGRAGPTAPLPGSRARRRRSSL